MKPLWKKSRRNFEASLGGNLFKKRIALKGHGKSGGSRIIVCFNDGIAIFALFAFKKSALGNISKSDLAVLKAAGASLNSLTEVELEKAIKDNDVFEI